MKKLRVVLIGIVFSAFLVFPLNSVLASQLDQSNETGVISDININGHGGLCAQTFKPSLPTLNYATVYMNAGNGDSAVIRVVRVADGTTLMSSTKTVFDDSWYMVSGDPVSVTPGETLKIFVSTTSATMQWRLGANNYANGEAYWPDADPSKDFYFRTYGTPSASPSVSPSASPTTSAAPGSGVVGSAPSKTTDSSIKPATDLKAEDVSDREKDEPKIKLVWEASKTTDIDGYRVYSRKEGDADFALAADINKATLEYTDAKVEFDKKYTYMIRANKGTKESESSNEVSITAKKEARELKNYGFLSFGGPLWKQWQFWSLVALGLALIGFVIWYIVGRIKRKKAEVNTLKS